MNSSKSCQLSVDYSELEKRVLALFSQPIESTLNLPRGSCKRTLHSMWLQHYGGMDTAELLRNLEPRSVPIISSDNSPRGTHAELLVHDEVLLTREQVKMQETNTAPIEWKVVLPEGANALPIKESMYSSGDYWTPFQDLKMQGYDRPHTEAHCRLLWASSKSAQTPRA